MANNRKRQRADSRSSSKSPRARSRARSASPKTTESPLPAARPATAPSLESTPLLAGIPPPLSVSNILNSLFGSGTPLGQDRLAAFPPGGFNRGGFGGLPPTNDDDIRPEQIDPNMGLDKVGGLEEQVTYLTRRILVPITAGPGRTEISRAVIKPVKGVIFHGPPGTGKSVLAKSLAASLSRIGGKPVSFFMRKGTDVYSKWVGESEKNLRTLFAKCERMSPSILFLDEIDGLCPARQDGPNQHHHTTSVVTSLLSLMDSVKPGTVFVIGATNRLSSLDPALLRPGRFDQHLYFSAPNEAGRLSILNIKLEEWGSSKPKMDLLRELAQASVGYTGADLEKLIATALDVALERQFPKFGTPGDTTKSSALDCLVVLREDWLKALATTSKSNANVFGNSSFTGEVMNEKIRPLIEGIVLEIRGRITNLASETDVCLGNKGLLVWDPKDSALLAIDNLLLPSVIGSLDTRKYPTFCLSLSESKTFVQNLNQALDSARDRPTILLVPRIDRLLIALRTSGAEQLLLEKFEQARGKNLTIVASAVCGVAQMPDCIKRLFVAKDMSYRVRAVSDCERRGFFEPLFNVDSKYHQRNGSKKQLAEFLNRAVTTTKDEDIGNLTTLHGLLTHVCVWSYDQNGPYNGLIKELDEILADYAKNKQTGPCNLPK